MPLYRRAWYGAISLAPIEVVAAMHPLGLLEATPTRIHARVADTSMLLNELVARVRLAKETALFGAARDGGLRLHIASTTLGEVEAKIPQRIARSGASVAPVDPSTVLSRWREDLLPRVRVVALEESECDPEELEAITTRDHTDVPTAALAVVLGPGSTWAGDADLVETGLAEPYVLKLVVAINEVCLVDVQLLTTARGAEMITTIGSDLIRAMRRMDGRGQLAVAGVVLALIAGAIVVLRRNAELRAGLGDVLELLGEAVRREFLQAYAGRQEWTPMLPTRLDLTTPRPERLIARTLAAAPVPLTPDEIHRMLDARSVALDTPAIRRELEARPMFVRAGRGIWQFGRHARR